MEYNELKKIIKKKYLQPSETIVIGASAGPDSMLLLSLLKDLQQELSLHLIVVHVHHGLRAEATEEANFVQSHCEQLALPCRIFYCDVNKRASEEKISSEAAGHQMRYACYEDVCKEVGATKLALGHHKNDWAESVLMHILRGTSVSGLATLRAKDAGMIRPLMEVTKKEILELCEKENIAYYWDASNDQPICQRNRIRLELLPYLREAYNPKIDDALCHLGQAAQEDEDYWKTVTYRAMTACALQDADGISLAQWRQYPRALQKRVLLARWKIYTDGKDLTFAQMEELMALAENDCGYKEKQLQGVYIIKEYDRMIFCRTKATAASYAFLWDMKTPLDVGEYLLTAEPFCEETQENLREERSIAVFAKKALPEQLLVRTRREGDVIATECGRKKVKKLLIDEKVPKELRDTLPLLFAGEELLWVGGIRISSNAKAILPQEEKICLRITKKRKK